ncbi:hypothetical protein EG68_08261 [Paragonimus skrjabini miyazakii]|uniref:Uncharacterized protein n=1 Tax=Paragonimus skrjabini miyazakii TaxID=59628 RepID=A0A8S9YJX3_9TREM|nr:hypothetical protein EG68_08261 [Paragonimus skrjabini miyazakii]
MDGGSPILVHFDVPKNCEDAVPLLDLKLPHFSKMIKKIMRKIDGGTINIEKTLLRVSHGGSLEPSPFKVVSEPEFKSDVLFARLPNGTGKNEIYQLPFTRLSVRRCDVQHEENHHSSLPLSESTANRSTLEGTLNRLAQRLDHIDSSLEALSAGTRTPSAKPVEQITPTKFISTDSRVSPGRAQASTPLAANDGVKKRAPTPARVSDPRHLEHLKNTIDHVLHRIQRDKQVGSMTTFENQLTAITFLMEASSDPPQLGADKSFVEESNAVEASSGKKRKHKKHKHHFISSQPGENLVDMDSSF